MKLLKLIDSINEWTGRVISFTIFPIIGIILFEVLMRYFLKRSQLWVPETSVFLFGCLFILGGGYAYLYEAHVRLDILYERFSPKTKAITDSIISLFFFIFCGILIWKGWEMAWESIVTLERSPSAFSPILFPYKILIPIGSILLLLQGLSKLVLNLNLIINGNKK